MATHSCSCLENPRDGGAWWAAVYGITRNRTRLKWLSSSSRLTKSNEKKSHNSVFNWNAAIHNQSGFICWRTWGDSTRKADSPKWINYSFPIQLGIWSGLKYHLAKDSQDYNQDVKTFHSCETAQSNFPFCTLRKLSVIVTVLRVPSALQIW